MSDPRGELGAGDRQTVARSRWASHPILAIKAWWASRDLRSSRTTSPPKAAILPTFGGLANWVTGFALSPYSAVSTASLQAKTVPPAVTTATIVAPVIRPDIRRFMFLSSGVTPGYLPGVDSGSFLL